MKNILQRIKTIFQGPAHILIGRAARNIYLWAFILFLRASFYDYHYTITETCYCLLLFIILLSLLYINNLLLLPYLLFRKRNILYIIAVCAAIFGAASLSAYIIRSVALHIPLMNVDRIVWVILPTKSHATALNFRSTCFYNFIFFTLYAFIFTLSLYITTYQKKQDELNEIKKKQAEIELAFLKGQLNPHFLFNTLNNLYGLALKKADNAPDAILELSLILRYLLYESDTPQVSFEKEKGIMQAYIKLELLRLSDVKNLNFNMEADAPYKIPPLLWLPILENIFKHGTRYITDDLMISYSCTIKQNKMHIHAENTYKPDVKHVEEKKEGIGMVNLQKRLALLYPGRHSINVTQTDNLYITDIQITLA